MAETKSLFPSALQLFVPSTEALRRNIISFVTIGFIPLFFFGTGVLSQVLTTDASSIVKNGAMVVGLLLFMAFIVFGLATAPGLSYIQYQSAKGNVVMPLQVYREVLRVGVRWWGLNIIVNLIYLVGLVCFVVPFFFMAKRYMMAQYHLQDKDIGVFEAMRLSANDARAYPEALWSIIGVQALLGAVMAIPLIGLAFGWIPNVLYACAPAIRYLQIKDARLKAPRQTR